MKQSRIRKMNREAWSNSLKNIPSNLENLYKAIKEAFNL